MTIYIQIFIGCLMSGIGTLILILISQVLSSIKEVKEEIKILQRMEVRIASLEEFKRHFEGCSNFKP